MIVCIEFSFTVVFIFVFIGDRFDCYDSFLMLRTNLNIADLLTPEMNIFSYDENGITKASIGKCMYLIIDV